MIAEKISIIEKVDEMNRLAFEIRNSDTHRSIALCKEAQALSSKIDYLEGKATALANEGFCNVQITNYEISLEKLIGALSIFENLKDEKGIANTQYNLTLVYFRLSDFSKGLDTITKAIQYYQKVIDKVNIARCMFQYGYMYLYLKDTVGALEYFSQSLQLNRELNNKEGEAAALMGLGQTYIDRKEYEKSKENLIQSMELREKINDKRGHAAAMNAYMTLCYDMGNYEESEKVSLKGIKLATELGDKMGIVRFMRDFGNICLKQNKIEKAEKVLLEALDISTKINFRRGIVGAHSSLAEVYEKKEDHKSALKHFQLFHKTNEETANTDTVMKAKSIQLISKIENAQKEAEINHLKNIELKKLNDEIAEKNKDITDSINYAKRIQLALLASDTMLKRNLKDFFIFYQPKDIVSGDFYWATETSEEKGKRFYFAVCDCTGHGVPGAFMSLLNTSYLNEAITEKNFHAPNTVLDHVRNRLIENISADGGQDGMDGILLSWEKGKIEYSAANNVPIVVHNGILKELDADNMPVGKGALQTHAPFQKYNLDFLNEGDIIYICTDGYADQFGGPKGKKLKKKNLFALLEKFKDHPMADQKQKLTSAFHEWKGGLDQVDDVLIVGIKI